MSFLRHLATLFIASGLIVALPALAVAQEVTPDEQVEEAPATRGSTLGATLAAELLEQLASEEGEMTASITDITERLETLGENIENAEAIFDEMTAAIERQAALGDPRGSFVQEIEALIEQARALEIEARELDDAEVVREMQGVVSSLEVVRSDVVALHADSFRALREIRAQRGSFVLRIRAGMLVEAVAVAEEGVSRMRDFNTRINEIRSSMASDPDTEIAE